MLNILYDHRYIYCKHAVFLKKNRDGSDLFFLLNYHACSQVDKVFFGPKVWLQMITDKANIPYTV